MLAIVLRKSSFCMCMWQGMHAKEEIACLFSVSLDVCRCSFPVRSFVAGAIHPPQSSAPLVDSFADILGMSLACMPTLHVGEKYWHWQSTTLHLNISPGFYVLSAECKGWIHQHVHTSVMCLLSSLWTKMGRRGGKGNKHRDAGADLAILMHKLYWNIDQLFSLWLPQGWAIFCLGFYCLD